MNSCTDPAPNVQRLEEAADWLIQLHDQPEDDALVADWLNWCDAAPENLEAFRKVQDTWFSTGRAARVHQARATEVPRASMMARASSMPAHTHRRQWTRWALAASLLLSVGLGSLLLQQSQLLDGFGLHTLSTPVAMHGSSVLEDGSRVELGAKSRIRTDFDEHRRRIVIESGEAYFEVAKDAARPFVVEARGLTVTAIGTAFNVRRGDERVVVTVSEGRVRLNTDAAKSPTAMPVLEAGAGERAVFSAREKNIELARTDPGVATAWREGVLKFKDEPLDEVVADLNRYSARRIELSDPELKDLRYTGTVFSNRLEDWLHAVENVFPVKVERRGSDRIVIEPRQRSS